MKLFIACAVLTPLIFAGCDSELPRGSERAMRRAERKYADGEFREAVAFYEKALDGTAETVEVHYRLGLIYDDKLREPVSALHHFQRYAALAPNGTHIKDVKAFIKQAELRLLTSLSRGAFTREEAARLKNENLALRQQLAALRASTARSNSAKTSAAAGTPKQKPIPKGAQTYVVKPGDTFASISRRFYKTSAQWKKIQDANFGPVQGTVTLKPGQELVIPK